MTPLIAELHRWASQPHRWGEFDCVTVLGDWVARWHGVDPAADIRLTYDSAAEAQRVYRFLTDPLAALASRLDPVLARTEDPKPGDIGLALWMDGAVARWKPALKIGQFWAFKSGGSGTSSVTIWTPPKIAAAWSVEHVA